MTLAQSAYGTAVLSLLRGILLVAAGVALGGWATMAMQDAGVANQWAASNVGPLPFGADIVEGASAYPAVVGAIGLFIGVAGAASVLDGIRTAEFSKSSRVERYLPPPSLYSAFIDLAFAAAFLAIGGALCALAWFSLDDREATWHWITENVAALSSTRGWYDGAADMPYVVIAVAALFLAVAGVEVYRLRRVFLPPRERLAAAPSGWPEWKPLAGLRRVATDPESRPGFLAFMASFALIVIGVLVAMFLLEGGQP